MKRFLTFLISCLLAIYLPAQTIVNNIYNGRLTTALDVNGQTLSHASLIEFGSGDDAVIGWTSTGLLTLTGSLNVTGTLSAGYFTIPGNTLNTANYAITFNSPGTLSFSGGNLTVTNFNGGSGASNSTFLRGDGLWAVPSSGAFLPLTGGTVTGLTSYSAGLYSTTLTLTSPLSVTSGGTGTTSPGLIAGTNVIITGAWPSQTVAVSGGGTVTGLLGNNGIGVSSSTSVPNLTLPFTLAGGGGTLTITNSPTISGSGTLTLGASLDVGTGGTLGSNAFNSTSFLPTAGGTVATLTDSALTAGLVGATAAGLLQTVTTIPSTSVSGLTSGTVTSVTLSPGPTGLIWTNVNTTSAMVGTLSGTLVVGNGGTGGATFATGQVLLGAGTGPFTSTSSEPPSFISGTAFTLAGGATVAGNNTFSSTLTIGTALNDTGTLSVSGAATLGGGLTVTGASTIQTISGTTATFATNLADTALTAGLVGASGTGLLGTVTNISAASLSGGTLLTVTVANGIGLVGGTVAPGGTFTLSLGGITPTSINTAGNSTLSGTLTIGTEIVTGTSSFSGAATFGGNVTVSGSTALQGMTAGNTTLSGTFTWNGAAAGSQVAALGVDSLNHVVTYSLAGGGTVTQVTGANGISITNTTSTPALTLPFTLAGNGGTLTITGSPTITGSNTITLASALDVTGGTMTLSGGGTYSGGGFTLTVPATGTAMLTAGLQTVAGADTFSALLTGATISGVSITGGAGNTNSVASVLSLSGGIGTGNAAFNSFTILTNVLAASGTSSQTQTQAFTLSNSGGFFANTGTWTFAGPLNISTLNGTTATYTTNLADGALTVAGFVTNNASGLFGTTTSIPIASIASGFVLTAGGSTVAGTTTFAGINTTSLSTVSLSDTGSGSIATTLTVGTTLTTSTLSVVNTSTLGILFSGAHTDSSTFTSTGAATLAGGLTVTGSSTQQTLSGTTATFATNLADTALTVAGFMTNSATGLFGTTTSIPIASIASGFVLTGGTSTITGTTTESGTLDLTGTISGAGVINISGASTYSGLLNTVTISGIPIAGSAGNTNTPGNTLSLSIGTGTGTGVLPSIALLTGVAVGTGTSSQTLTTGWQFGTGTLTLAAVNTTLTVLGDPTNLTTNTVPLTLTISPNTGTGNAVGNSIVFNVPVPTTTGTTSQTLTQAFTLSTGGYFFANIGTTTHAGALDVVGTSTLGTVFGGATTLSSTFTSTGAATLAGGLTVTGASTQQTLSGTTATFATNLADTALNVAGFTINSATGLFSTTSSVPSTSVSGSIQTVAVAGQTSVTLTTGSTLTLVGAGAITITTSGQNITLFNAAGGGGTMTSITLSGGTTGLNFTTTGSNSAASTTLAGTLVGANGGTGLTGYAVGDLLYGSGTSTLSKLADVAVGQVLVSGGVTTAPAWAASINLTTLTLSGFLNTASFASTTSGSVATTLTVGTTITAGNMVGTGASTFGSTLTTTGAATLAGGLTVTGSSTQQTLSGTTATFATNLADTALTAGLVGASATGLLGTVTNISAASLSGGTLLTVTVANGMGVVGGAVAPGGTVTLSLGNITPTSVNTAGNSTFSGTLTIGTAQITGSATVGSALTVTGAAQVFGTTTHSGAMFAGLSTFSNTITTDTISGVPIAGGAGNTNTVGNTVSISIGTGTGTAALPNIDFLTGVAVGTGTSSQTLTTGWQFGTGTLTLAAVNTTLAVIGDPTNVTTNTAPLTITFSPNTGTGNANGSSFVFNVPVPTTSGTTSQTLTPSLTIASNGNTFANTGTTTFGGALTITGAATLAGGITVTGSSTQQTLSGTTATFATNLADGALTVAGFVTNSATGLIGTTTSIPIASIASGFVLTAGGSTVAGTTTFAGINTTSLSSTSLSATGSGSFGTTLTIGTTLTTSTLSVTNNSTLSAVYGTTETLSGNLYTASLAATSSGSVATTLTVGTTLTTSTLSVINTSTLSALYSGVYTDSGALTATGAATLAGGLTVTGSSTLQTLSGTTATFATNLADGALTVAGFATNNAAGLFGTTTSIPIASIASGFVLTAGGSTVAGTTTFAGINTTSLSTGSLSSTSSGSFATTLTVGTTLTSSTVSATTLTASTGTFASTLTVTGASALQALTLTSGTASTGFAVTALSTPGFVTNNASGLFGSTDTIPSASISGLLTSTSYTATIYIDATTGSNSTAQIGQPLLPFSDPVAAQAAATAATLSGVQFIVRPGTYTVAAAVVKPGTMNEEWIAPYGTATFTAQANLNDQILRSANITNTTNTTSGTTGIRIANINFNGNGTNQSTGYYPTVWLNGETGVVMENVQFFNPFKYCFLGTNLTNFNFNYLQFNSAGGINQDGLHLLGSQQGTVQNIWGTTEDDLVSVVTNETGWTSNGATVSGQFGRVVSDMYFHNITAVASGGIGIRLGTNSYSMQRVLVDGDHGASVDGPVFFYAGAGATGSFSGIVLNNIDGESGLAAGQIMVSANVNDLTVNNLGFHPNALLNQSGIWVSAGTSLSNLILSGGVFNPNQYYATALVNNQGYIGNAQISGVTLYGSTVSGAINEILLNTGTYGSISIVNANLTNAATAVAITNTPAGTLTLTNVRSTGANTGSLVTVTSVSAGNVYFVDSSTDGTGGLIGGAGGTWTASVLTSSISIPGTLTVSGAAGLASTLTVGSAITGSSTIAVPTGTFSTGVTAGALTATGASSLAGLTFTSGTDSGALTVTGAASIVGALTLGSTLYSTSAGTFASTLTVTGASALQALTLTSGTASGTFTVTGSATDAGALTVSGSSLLQALTAAATTVSALTITGSNAYTTQSYSLTLGATPTVSSSLSWSPTISLSNVIGNTTSRSDIANYVIAQVAVGYRPTLFEFGDSFVMGSNGGSQATEAQTRWFQAFGYGGPGYCQFGGGTGSGGGIGHTILINGGGNGGGPGLCFYPDNIVSDGNGWNEWTTPQTSGTGSFSLNGTGVYRTSTNSSAPLYLMAPAQPFTQATLAYAFGTGGGTVYLMNSANTSVSVSATSTVASTQVQFLAASGLWKGTASDTNITITVSNAAACYGIYLEMPTGGIVNATGLGGQTAHTFAQLDATSRKAYLALFNPVADFVCLGKNDFATYTATTFASDMETILNNDQAAIAAMPIVVEVPWSNNNMNSGGLNYQPSYANAAASVSGTVLYWSDILGNFPNYVFFGATLTSSTVTTGSSAVTVNSAYTPILLAGTTGLGQVVTGGPFPSGTKLQAVSNSTTISLSNTATSSGTFTLSVGSGDYVHPGPEAVQMLGEAFANYGGARAGPLTTGLWPYISTDYLQNQNLISNTASDSSFTGASTHWTGDNWSGAGTVTLGSGFLQVNAPNSNYGGAMLTSGNFGGALTPGATYEVLVTVTAGTGYMNFYTYDGSTSVNWNLFPVGGSTAATGNYAAVFTPTTSATSINFLLVAGSAGWTEKISNVKLFKISNAASFVGDAVSLGGNTLKASGGPNTISGSGTIENLTAGSNITLTYGANTLTISSSGGGGSGTVLQVTSPNSTLTITGTTSTVTADLNLSHANVWTGAQSLTNALTTISSTTVTLASAAQTWEMQQWPTNTTTNSTPSSLIYNLGNTTGTGSGLLVQWQGPTASGTGATGASTLGPLLTASISTGGVTGLLSSFTANTMSGTLAVSGIQTNSSALYVAGSLTDSTTGYTSIYSIGSSAGGGGGGQFLAETSSSAYTMGTRTDTSLSTATLSFFIYDTTNSAKRFEINQASGLTTIYNGLTLPAGPATPLQFTTNALTATSSPLTINLGGVAGNTTGGKNGKIRLYDDGTAADQASIGFSTLANVEFTNYAGNLFIWYNNAAVTPLATMTLGSGGVLTVSTAITVPTGTFSTGVTAGALTATGASSLAGLTFTSGTDSGALTLSGVAAGTQVSSLGLDSLNRVVTFSAGGGSGIPQITSTLGSLTLTSTTSTTDVEINLGHSNTFTVAQTISSTLTTETVSGIPLAAQSGTNSAGNTLSLSVGIGTGTGTHGLVDILTAVAAASGSTSQTLTIGAQFDTGTLTFANTNTTIAVAGLPTNTSTNTAPVTLTISGATGSGTGAGNIFIFNTPVLAASGSASQTQTQAITIANNSILFANIGTTTFNGPVSVVGTPSTFSGTNLYDTATTTTFNGTTLTGSAVANFSGIWTHSGVIHLTSSVLMGTNTFSNTSTLSTFSGATLVVGGTTFTDSSTTTAISGTTLTVSTTNVTFNGTTLTLGGGSTAISMGNSLTFSGNFGINLNSGDVQLLSPNNGVFSLNSNNPSGAFRSLNFNGQNNGQSSAIVFDAVNDLQIEAATNSSTLALFTWTDSSTATTTTVATRFLFGVGTTQPTLAAVNSAVTYTNVYDVLIGLGPAAGTNVTATNTYSLGVLGTSTFGGLLTASGGISTTTLSTVGAVTMSSLPSATATYLVGTGNGGGALNYQLIASDPRLKDIHTGPIYGLDALTSAVDAGLIINYTWKPGVADGQPGEHFGLNAAVAQRYAPGTVGSDSSPQHILVPDQNAQTAWDKQAIYDLAQRVDQRDGSKGLLHATFALALAAFILALAAFIRTFRKP